MLDGIRRTLGMGSEGSEAMDELGDMDPLYARHGQGSETEDTPSDEDGTQNREAVDFNKALERMERLEREQQTLEKRLADKDRHITSLSQQLNTTNRLIEGLGQSGGSEPSEEDAYPDIPADVVADLEDLIEAGEVAKATAIMTQYAARAASERADSRINQREVQTQNAERLRAVFQNIQAQAQKAKQEFGEDVAELVDPFLTAQTDQEAANTWLGQRLMQDQTLALSPNGIYRELKLEMMDRGVEGSPGVQEQPRPTPRPQGNVPRAGRVERDVRAGQSGQDEVPIEDRIGEAIVESAKGNDAESRRLLMGTA